MKYCNTCHQLKPHSDYGTHTKSSDGLSPTCKLCLSQKRQDRKGETVRDLTHYRRMKAYETFDTWQEMADASGVSYTVFQGWAKRHGLKRKRQQQPYTPMLKYLEYLLVTSKRRFGVVTEDEIGKLIGSLHHSNKLEGGDDSGIRHEL